MSVRETTAKPDCMAHFPDDYRWLELHDADGVYGHSAIKERGETMELHVTLSRWGPQVRRQIQGDVRWLRKEAKRLGLNRIMGVRADTGGSFDPGLFRFAKLFGFTNHCVFQTASMSLD